MSSITENVTRLLEEIPAGVGLVAVAKTRTATEVAEAIAAGARIIGQNYLQEAVPVLEELKTQAGGRLPDDVSWHFIGHMQSNKIGPIVSHFQMIETLDSVKHARRLERLLTEIDRTMPVLLEINSGREEAKQGLLPEEVPAFIEEIASLERIKVQGLMTMGPWDAGESGLRQAFRDTSNLYRELKAAALPGIVMQILSMGMSSSWRLAVEEGANLVRIGADLFGSRGA